MKISLTKAAIIHSFSAPDSASPTSSALIRLASVVTGALLLGIGISQLVREMPLQAVSDPDRLIFSVIFTAQITTLLSLITSQGMLKVRQQEKFMQILTTLPISKKQLWLIYMLPSIVLVLLTSILLYPAVVSVFQQLGMSLPAIIAALILGTLSAFGLLTSAKRFTAITTLLWPASVLTIEYFLIKKILTGDNSIYQAAFVCVLILVACLAIIFHSKIETQLSQTATVRSPQLRLPYSLWMLTKLIRRPSTQLTFSSSILISSIVAFGTYRFNMATLDLVAFFTAVFAASVATDLRSVCRRKNPAEITALRGSGYFSANYILIGVLFGLSAVLPFFVLGYLLDFTLANYGNIFIKALLGTATGLLAGSTIIPEGRDYSSQFVASGIIIAILMFIPRLPGMQQASPTIQLYIEIALSLAFLCSTAIIEIKRNPYFWRRTHAQ